MRPSDEPPNALVVTTKAAPRASRSIRVRDYALPKPYRRRKFVEDAPAMSRTRMMVLALSGLTIVGLITALAMLARENFDNPPVLVIAAPLPGAAAGRTAAPVAPRLAATVPLVPVPVASRPRITLHGLQDPPPPVRSVLLTAAKIARAARLAPLPEAPPPDPDVVLITAILTLTMPAMQASATSTLAACPAGAPGDSGCPALHGMEP